MTSLLADDVRHVERNGRHERANRPTLPAAFGLPDIPLPPEMAKMMGVPTLVGVCVPQTGMHAILATKIERKDAFSGTMVIGYHKGKPIFVEPMVAKAMLMKKASFREVREVEAEFSGPWSIACPTAWCAERNRRPDGALLRSGWRRGFSGR